MACIILAACPVHAENDGRLQEKHPSGQPEVRSIKISGNKAVQTDEIQGIMLTSASSSFLGTGLFGGAPRLFSHEDFEKDIALIKKLYTFKGYFFTALDTTVTYLNRGRRVDLSILVRENEPSRIDSLRYDGIDSLSPSIRLKYINEGHLKKKDVFSVENLIRERDRTIDFFREYGYTFLHPDSIKIRVDTVGQKAGVAFRVNLPKKLAYGAVRAVVHDQETQDNEQLVHQFTRDSISVKIYGHQKFLDNLFTHSIAYRPLAHTRQSLEQQTLQNLGSTNLFSSVSISSDSVSNGKLYTTLHLEPNPKHQIEPKIVLDNRYGALFIGGALAYENRNLFGGAEQLRISTDYGRQTVFNNDLMVNLAEGQYDKVIPYELNLKGNLVMPVLKKQGASYSTGFEYSLSALPVLLSSRRAIARSSYSSKLGKNGRLTFDFFEIELAQKDSLHGFKQLFKTDLAKNIGIDPANEARVKSGIDSLLQTRITQTFRLQYNYSNRYDNSPLRTTIWNLDTSAEESGSLLWLLDQCISTNNDSGSSNIGPQFSGIAYSQYVKLNTQLSVAHDLSADRQMAGRINVGWMSPYGKATVTPDERHFYAGGANSMRGWLFSRLGPGSNSNAVSSNLGAEIKLELGAEYRMKLFRLFGQPSGITLFTDIGNIWNRTGPYALSLESLQRDFAWDWGVGLRIGSPIGPFRFDFAWKIHDPSDPSPWKISRTDFSDFTFNFGIGEAF